MWNKYKYNKKIKITNTTGICKVLNIHYCGS